jgi:hypothetical protein
MRTLDRITIAAVSSILSSNAVYAADFSVKAKAVDFVTMCTSYAAGFFFIPETDTCIKLGGYLRVDTTFNGGPQGKPAWNGDLTQQNRYRDYYAARSRFALTELHALCRGDVVSPGSKVLRCAILAPAAPKPTTLYEFRDQDAFSLQLRAQRNFYGGGEAPNSTVRAA